MKKLTFEAHELDFINQRLKKADLNARFDLIEIVTGLITRGDLIKIN